MEADFKLVENEGLFQEYLEMGRQITEDAVAIHQVLQTVSRQTYVMNDMIYGENMHIVGFLIFCLGNLPQWW